MTDGTCTVPGCGKYGRLTRGWCAMHYRRWHLYGSHELPEREPARCSVEGCDAPGRISKGYCGRHLRRIEAHGDPGPPGRVYRTKTPDGALCEIDGCDRGGLLRRGWCTLHYQRWQQHGDPRWTPPPAPIGCTVNGCDGEHEANGLCQRHYMRVIRTGSTDDPEPHVPSPCAVDECDDLAIGLGYCSRHYARVKRHGDPLVMLREREDRTSDWCTLAGCGLPYHAKGMCLPHYSAWKHTQNREQANARMRAHYRANRAAYYTKTQARRQRVAALEPEDRAISAAYRMAIAGDPCCYCGGPSEHVDHFYPIAKGGTDHWWNLRPACGTCNRRKAAHCGTWFLLSGRAVARLSPAVAEAGPVDRRVDGRPHLDLVGRGPLGEDDREPCRVPPKGVQSSLFWPNHYHGPNLADNREEPARADAG